MLDLDLNHRPITQQHKQCIRQQMKDTKIKKNQIINKEPKIIIFRNQFT